MSRFIRRGGTSSTSTLTLSDINQGFTNLYSTQTSGTFTFPGSSTRAKIIVTGGGGGGSYQGFNGYNYHNHTGGGGGGTVIAYIDTSLNKTISFSVGAAGCTCLYNCTLGCTNCGTNGGNTVVAGSTFSITACGGTTGTSAPCGFAPAQMGLGGCGSASGALCCFIIVGGSGSSTLANWCFAYPNTYGAVPAVGGNTYFGIGGRSNGACCSGSPYSFSCATYGGGGSGGFGCCGGCFQVCPTLIPVQPAAGLVYIEYN